MRSRDGRSFEEVYDEQLSLMWGRYYRYGVYINPIIKGFMLFFLAYMGFGFRVGLIVYACFFAYSMICLIKR